MDGLVRIRTESKVVQNQIRTESKVDQIRIWTESKVVQNQIRIESKLYFMSVPEGVTTQNSNTRDVAEIQLDRFLETLKFLTSFLFVG